MFYFPSGITALFGLALAGWLVYLMLKSAMRGFGYTDVPAESLNLPVMYSKSGKSRVEKACRYPSMKRFYAKVDCQELNYSWNIWAVSKEELERKVLEEFRECDERLRARINKHEMKKSMYFRIG